MRTLATTTIAFAFLLSGSAYAGGNPDEEDFGVGTRDPLPQAAPVIPDQYEIQQKIEAEIFARPQIKPEPLKAEPAPEPVTIARAAEDDGCKHPLPFLADLIGGCYELNATLGDEHVLTAEDGPQFETQTKTRTKMKSFRSKWSAKHYAKHKRAKGWATKIERIRTKYGKRYKVTATKTYTFQVEVERDSGNAGRNTAADSNFGDRERDFGPGRGNK